MFLTLALLAATQIEDAQTRVADMTVIHRQRNFEMCALFHLLQDHRVRHKQFVEKLIYRIDKAGLMVLKVLLFTPVHHKQWLSGLQLCGYGTRPAHMWGMPVV